MKLYNANLSPFASRPRMQIYAKKLEVEICDPPGFHTPEYEALNPIGKVPALQLDDGRVLPESQVICEYLEEKFPDPALMPGTPEARGFARLLTRVCDLYVMEPMGPLFMQMSPKNRDQAVVDDCVARVNKGVDYLDKFLDGSKYAVDGKLTLADCALVPVLFFVASIMPAFGESDMIGARANVNAYFDAVSKDPVASRVLGELQEALAEVRRQKKAG